MSRFLLIPCCLLLLSACQAPMRRGPVDQVLQGEFGVARERVARNMTTNRRERQYLLDRLKLGVVMLADGRPDAAQVVFEEIYEILRTQGINQDKTVASVVTYEGVKFWKGEPFEQALGLFYYAVQQAELGQWDNARAAAGNALFRLRDFGEDQGTGERIDTLQIARRALEYERAQVGIGVPREARGTGGDYLDHGYAVRESNFTLAYLMRGIASQQLGRLEEANDLLAAAQELEPRLRDVVSTIRGRHYNTILIVSLGVGPEKVAYGPDRALARFVPRFQGDQQPLRVSAGSAGPASISVACDVNLMASDHMWNNLEDVRLAKSAVGDLLLTGGALAAYVGAHHSEEALYAGLAAMLAGLLSKAGAAADTRYCDLLPQRFYVVPLQVVDPGAPVVLEIQGIPGSRLVLRGLSVPPGPQAQLRYVRLASARDFAPAWASSPQVHYANPITGPTDGPQLPYILGGRCVRHPGTGVLRSYQDSGYLTQMTVNELRQLYDDEGLVWRVEDEDARWARHVLEGGQSLVPPLGGTTGFARIFGQVHPPYRPKSDRVRRLQQEVGVLP